MKREIGLFAAAFFIAVNPAMAGWDGVQSAHATFIEGNQGTVFLYVDTAPQSTPPCGTQTVASLRYAINESTTTGKAQLAIALSAIARGATIVVQGPGACTAWPDTEDIYWIRSN
jgi:hypothetical protein